MGTTIDLMVAPWKFYVFKTRIFVLEASLLEKIFLLRTSNFREAAMSRYDIHQIVFSPANWSKHFT